MANARLGWFSPLGLAASSRASARWLAFGFTASAFRPAPLRSCRSASWPSGSLLPLFGPHRFGVALGGLVFGLISSAFRPAPLRSGHWASSFFRLPFRRLPSAGWPSGSPLPLFGTRRFGVAAGRLAFGLIASEIAIWRVGLWAHRFGNSARRVGLRVHCFRFSARTDSEWLLGEFVLPPSVSEIAIWRVGLRAHCFRFSARTASELPSAGWPSGSLLPLFGTHRFGVALGGLAFGLTASAFRHVPLRGCRWAGWPSGSRLPLFGTYRFGDCRSAGWPSGSRLSLFGTHRSAPPYRRREGRRSTPTRHLFHFKTLISTC